MREVFIVIFNDADACRTTRPCIVSAPKFHKIPKSTEWRSERKCEKKPQYSWSGKGNRQKKRKGAGKRTEMKEKDKEKEG